MPPSKSGRNRERKKKESPRKRIPEPVIAQPVSKASALATAAIFCGRLKIPEPIIELSTSAVSDTNPILLFDIKCPFIYFVNYSKNLHNLS